MLPSSMLITRTRKGKVVPAFAQTNEVNLEIASEMISVFAGSAGRRKGGIVAELDAIESSSVEQVDYRFIRGLKTLLLRRCVFEMESTLAPELARRKVFREAAREGAVTTEEKRTGVLRAVARELGVTPGELEASLWADHEDELILRGFGEISPGELLRSYNLSLAQTLLFKAVSIELSLSNNYQRVFRRIKSLGLMYHCEKGNGEFSVTVEGPLSLFKMTEKYGTAMAKLLPDIVDSGDWEVRADIVLRGYDGAPRSLRFELDSESAPPMESGGAEEREVFDSSVEKGFAESFGVLDTGWTLTREPEPLLAGRFVFIPDFMFRKRDMKVYMEVVGFWTEDYLKKKLYKLRRLEEENLIIAVDRKLACSEFEGVKGEVIYYRKEVPLKEVLASLRRHEEKNRKKELDGLRREKVELQGDVIRVEALAEQYNVGRKTILERVKGEEGYVLVGSELVSREKLRELKQWLDGLPPRAEYAVVEEKLVGVEGISSVNSLLGCLGYKAEWPTLNPKEAVVTTRRR